MSASSAQLRSELVAAARALHAGGYNVGTAGNISLRQAEGMLITPSAVPYELLGEDDLVFVGVDGKASGPRRPSSEWQFHLAIYRQQPEAQAVVHTHSLHATALACLGRSIPAFHYEVALAGGTDIPCAAYATFGTAELAASVAGALAKRRACLIANHGLVCHGPDLQAALALAQKLEHLAGIYLQCLAAGEPRLLDEAEMARVAVKFRAYAKHEL